MAQIGLLGDIVFSVSSETIRTIDKAIWSGSVRYGEHQRHLKNALTEFTGIDPDEFSFEMVLSAYFGVDPMADLVKIWNYERKGTSLPLVLGTKGYGKYRWVIKSHKIKMQTYDKAGNLTGATVSVDLIEYLRS